MKRLSLVTLVCFMVGKLFSQSLAGITGIRDTSYTTYKAWASDRKKFAEIKIVEEFTSLPIKEKKDIVYCKKGERELLLDAFCPEKKSKVKRTAVIIIHGGGWRSGNRTQHYPLAQKLASLGYVCFTPEYRLSTEALFPAAVHDVKAAVKWVKGNARRYNIDSNKITILGFSAGGELVAFMGATNGMAEFDDTGCNLKTSSVVNAVLNIDGTLSFVHPESGEGDDTKKVSAATYWFGFSKKENPQLWKKASPLTHAGSHTPATLFINSAVDRMHAGREDYIKILNSHNIYTEVQHFENSPHSFCLYHPWFEPTVRYIDEFLKKVFSNK